MQAFGNNSGKSQPIRTKFSRRERIKGRQRSGNFGRCRPSAGTMGTRMSSAQPGFIVRKTKHHFVDFPIADSHHIWLRHVNPCPSKLSKGIFQNFPFRSNLPPENSKLKGVKQTPCSVKPRGLIAERSFSLHVIVQGSGSFPCLVSFLYDVWFWDIKFLQFWHFFAYITKQNAYNVRSSDQVTGQGLQCRMFLVIPFCSGRVRYRNVMDGQTDGRTDDGFLLLAGFSCDV